MVSFLKSQMDKMLFFKPQVGKWIDSYLQVSKFN